MNQIACFIRLTAMRRRTGASLLPSVTWAAGLLWRNYRTSQRRQHIERRAQVERAARQRL